MEYILSSQFNNPHLLERAISIIDLFTINIAKPWLTMSEDKLTSNINNFFLEDRTINKFILNRCVNDRNINIFFLSLERKAAIAFFKYYNIPIDAGYNEIDAVMSEIEGKSEWEINPFEVQVLRHYLDWCIRGDIGIIIDLETDFYERMKKAEINPLGKNNEWHKVWEILDLYEKCYLINSTRWRN